MIEAMSVQIALLSMLAAFLAGIINAAAGGGAFLTYPVLLLAGLPSTAAYATSGVAIWPGTLASLTGYKKEIRQNRKWAKRLFIPVLIGAVIGSHLLIKTPDSVFIFIAPALITFGSLTLLFQKQVHRYFHKLRFDGPAHRVLVVTVLIFLISIYGAYFGAGVGIILIGMLSLLSIGNIYRTIALKNEIALVVNLVASTYFIIHGLVHWQYVPLMVVGTVSGGYLGARWVHHFNKSLVQKLVATLGLAISATLLIAHFR